MPKKPSDYPVRETGYGNGIVPKSMDKYSRDMELTEGNRFKLLQQMDRSLHLRILFQSVAL